MSVRYLIASLKLVLLKDTFPLTEKSQNLGVVTDSCNLALMRLRQECQEFEAIVDFIARLS